MACDRQTPFTNASGPAWPFVVWPQMHGRTSRDARPPVTPLVAWTDPPQAASAPGDYRAPWEEGGIRQGSCGVAAGYFGVCELTGLSGMIEAGAQPGGSGVDTVGKGTLRCGTPRGIRIPK